MTEAAIRQRLEDVGVTTFQPYKVVGMHENTIKIAVSWMSHSVMAKLSQLDM
jgi:hypothetical protein